MKTLLLLRHASQRFYRHPKRLRLVEGVSCQLVEDGEIRLVDIPFQFAAADLARSYRINKFPC